MRRITRRIGLFGGPGAIVRAAGAGKGKRGPDAAEPDSQPAIPPGAEGESAGPSEGKSWLRWFGGPKSKKSG
jgi:hypothetical protein